MTGLLIDTDALSCVIGATGLTPRAREAIAAADETYTSAVSLYEIALKVRLGKWPEMNEFSPNLPALVPNSGITILPLTAEVAHLAGSLDWDHRDPFDRLIVAQAIVSNLPLVSSDRAIGALGAAPGRGHRATVW